MRSSDEPSAALLRLFRRQKIADIAQLCAALETGSRMTVFRRLSAVGYVSSYSHAGRYYTLASVPDFDADGLWRYRSIGFSRDGTLKATVERLVVASDAGRTQRELQLRLGVRVHNPLLDLALDKKLGRETIEHEYVYVAPEHALASAQLGRRRALAIAGAATAAPTPAFEVEVLLDVIHGVRVPPPDATTITARLVARGIRAHVTDVAAVLDRHSLCGKKTPPSHSPHSRP
jgi:hypothetical protein